MSKLNALWELHLASEFQHKDAEEALSTMTDNPRVNVVPLMVGGQGVEEMRTFYSKHFLNQLPPDLEVTPVSRTIGERSIADELIIRFTHTMVMDWVLPGIAPTGKRIEFAMVAIVYVDVESGKISGENIYWDNATVLKQAGLLTQEGLPVVGSEAARSVVEPLALNELIPKS